MKTFITNMLEGLFSKAEVSDSNREDVIKKRASENSLVKAILDSEKTGTTEKRAPVQCADGYYLKKRHSLGCGQAPTNPNSGFPNTEHFSSLLDLRLQKRRALFDE